MKYYVRKNLKEANLLERASHEDHVVAGAIISMYRDLFKPRWDDKHNDVHNKLRSYGSFKRDIVVESYVTTLMPFYYRKYLAMLRCGSPPL